MTPRKDIVEIIARRELFLDDNGERRKVTLLLGKPHKDPHYEEYSCPYQILGAGDEKVRAVCGIDEVQALQLTIRVLGAELYSLNRELGGKLRWLGEPGDFGFEKEMKWLLSEDH